MKFNHLKYIMIFKIFKKLYALKLVTLLCLFFLLTNCFVQAQKVFSVQYANQADLKVFVVDYPNQADLKVYKVKYNNQVGKNNGLWFFTQYANQADKKIFFVQYANQAEVKIYFVEYQNQAGWNNNSKKHLMY